MPFLVIPFLERPVTGLEFLFFITVAAVAGFFFFLLRRPKPIWETEIGTTGISWKKGIPVMVAVGLLVLYPFVPPLLHWLTGLFYGAGGTDRLGNVDGATVAADQVAGGGVQLGTFITKLWITIIFFLLFTVLPWRVQQVTHPAPSEWAKGTKDPVTGEAIAGYRFDFTALTGPEKFNVYGRLQLVLTIKIVGAALVAALLV